MARAIGAPALDDASGNSEPWPAESWRDRLGAELRSCHMVWRREMLHFVRDPTRAIFSLLQPMLFLFVLGVGLSRLFANYGGGHADRYLVFLFPGVLVMAAQAPAISAGASIVWDRQSGFLREMLVAPVGRGTLLVGKCLGGATVATFQSAVVLTSAGLIHIPYRISLFAPLLAELGLTALMMTVLSALIAVTVRRVQTLNTVLSVLITPLIFLSGMMFPINAMPTWMATVALANPLTYAVEAMRLTATAGLDAGPPSLTEPIAWGTWHPPLLLDLGLVATLTLVVLALTSRRFSRIE